MAYVFASHSHSLVPKWPCLIVPVSSLDSTLCERFDNKNRKNKTLKHNRQTNRTIDRMSPGRSVALVLAILNLVLLQRATGLLRRCVNCRSRGELGSCKDPFTMNSTEIELEKGVDSVPCASGWCGKIIERHGINNEYGTATQRLCFQRGPDDGEERCAYTVWNYKKVYMCLCFGDLCNGTGKLGVSSGLIFATLCVTLRRFV